MVSSQTATPVNDFMIKKKKTKRKKVRIYPKIGLFISLFFVINLMVIFYFWKNILIFQKGNDEILKLNEHYSQRITSFYHDQGKEIGDLGRLARFVREEALMLMKRQEEALYMGLKDLIYLTLLFLICFSFFLWRSFVSIEKQTKLANDYFYQAEKEKQTIKVFTDLVPSALYMVDKDRRITLWNKKIAQLTGYSEQEALGKECFLFAERPCCEDECRLFSDKVEKPILSAECEVKDKSGKKLVVSKNADLLKDAEGNITGGIETFVDITARKEEEEEIRYINKLLRDNEEKTKKMNQELAEKITALERTNEHMKGRELRIIEIKEEVNRLSQELGRTPPYKV